MAHETFISIAASGVLGNLIGAWISIRTTQRLIDAEIRRDEKRRAADAEADYAAALTMLREEVRLNTFPHQPINEVVAIFSTDAWRDFKLYAKRLEAPLLESLTRAYSRVHSHRIAADFGKAGVQNPYGGTLKLLFGEAVEEFRTLSKKL